MRTNYNINGIDIYNRILKILQERKTKTSDFYNKIGITRQNFSKWKSGSIPSFDVLYKIKEELNISLDFLLTGNEEYFYFTKDTINMLCSILKYLSLTPPSERFGPYINIYSCKEAYVVFSDLLTKTTFSEREEQIKGNLKYILSEKEINNFNFLLDNYSNFCDFLIKHYDNIHSYESNYGNGYFAEIYQRINCNY